MKTLFFFLAVIFVIVSISDPGYAYSLPRDDSRAPYFCVFGLRGNRDDGAEKANPEQVIFFDVPENTAKEITIDIFDPDTGGQLDQKDDGNENWETIFQFAVYGKKDSLLEKKSFGESSDYDGKYYRFGPYAKEIGSRIEGFYRFKLVVSPISTVILKGDDLNLYGVRVSPEEVEASVGKIAFRLADRVNEEMYFYPEVPANTSEVIVANYDLDPDGGLAKLYDPLTNESFAIKNSGSGVWEETRVQVKADPQPRRLAYIITKKTQQYANASIMVKDRQGRLLPIYFSKAARKAAPETAAAILPVQAEKVKIVPVAQPGKDIVPARNPAAVKQAKSVLAKQEKPVVAPLIKTPGLSCNQFTFDGTGSYDPDNEKLSFFWDFGDSFTSTEPVVTHVFEKGGQYKVILTVKDTSGLACATSSATQIVKVNTPPVAIGQADFACCIDTDSVFDGSASSDADGDRLTYQWDFGDGAAAEGVKVNHRYSKGGVYSVILKVDDNSGTACGCSQTSFKVRINEPPVAVIKFK